MLPVVSSVQYVEPGYLVFVREGTLVGQRSTPTRAEIVGAPFSIASSGALFLLDQRCAIRDGAGRRTGAITPYVDQERLVWIDRTGHERGNVGPTGTYISLRISPEGGRVLFSRAQPQIGTFDLWVTDLERGGEQRLTSDLTSEVNGVWQPRRPSMFFAADRGGPPHLFRKDLRTGAETEVMPPGGLQMAEDISPDGTTLVFTDRTGGDLNIWTIPVDGRGAGAVYSSTPFDGVAGPVLARRPLHGLHVERVGTKRGLHLTVSRQPARKRWSSTTGGRCRAGAATAASCSSSPPTAV